MHSNNNQPKINYAMESKLELLVKRTEDNADFSRRRGRNRLNVERTSRNAEAGSGDWEVPAAERREDVSRGDAENAEEILGQDYRFVRHEGDDGIECRTKAPAFYGAASSQIG